MKTKKQSNKAFLAKLATITVGTGSKPKPKPKLVGAAMIHCERLPKPHEVPKEVDAKAFSA